MRLIWSARMNGREPRIFDPRGLPQPDGVSEDHPRVQELRELAQWSEAWCGGGPVPIASNVVFAAGGFTSTAMAAHLPRLLLGVGASLAAAVGIAALVGPAQVAGWLIVFAFLSRAHPLLSARLATLAHPLAVLFIGLLGSSAARQLGSSAARPRWPLRCCTAWAMAS